MPLQLSDMKMVLTGMPRLRLLTQLDQEGLYEFNTPQMRELIRPHAEEYRRVVLRDQLPGDMDVKGALKVYCNFKLLRASPTWGDYPVSRSCKTNFGGRLDHRHGTKLLPLSFLGLSSRQTTTRSTITFTTVLPNCELAENELLSPPPAQETERKEGWRTPGRSSGAGRRKD